VNPGNTGGPLVDIKGRIIGMNVAIATGAESRGTTEGQSAGISFAIPLGTIESVVDQLITHGNVSRGYLGVSWDRRDDAVIYDEVAHSTGMRVVQVMPDGPAAQAGIKSGDLITSIAGQPVTSPEVLRSVITSMRPGQEVAVKGVRAKQLQEFSVTLGEYPQQDLARNAIAMTLARYGLGLRGTGRDGPFVARVIQGSAAAEAGFKEGQAIVSVGGKAVESLDQVYLAAADQGLLLGRSVPFVVDETDEDASTSKSRTIDVRISH
jgi:serine protease Do